MKRSVTSLHVPYLFESVYLPYQQWSNLTDTQNNEIESIEQSRFTLNTFRCLDAFDHIIDFILWCHFQLQIKNRSCIAQHTVTLSNVDDSNKLPFFFSLFFLLFFNISSPFTISKEQTRKKKERELIFEDHIATHFTFSCHRYRKKQVGINSHYIYFRKEKKTAKKKKNWMRVVKNKQEYKKKTRDKVQ